MRRIDVWVGRIAAVAGIVYVALAGLWPLSAAAVDDGIGPGPAVERCVAHREAVIGSGDPYVRAGLVSGTGGTPQVANPRSLPTARTSSPANEPDAPTIAMLVVSFVTAALMALLSRSDAMTARFYTDIG